MAFLVRCYANCLQPWSSKVSDVIVVVCVCLWIGFFLHASDAWEKHLVFLKAGINEYPAC